MIGTIVENVYIAPLVAADFATHGFDLPQVQQITDSQGKRGFVAYTTKEAAHPARLVWAEMLSPRSGEDAVERLAREIRRNRQ